VLIIFTLTLLAILGVFEFHLSVSSESVVALFHCAHGECVEFGRRVACDPKVTIAYPIQRVAMKVLGKADRHEKHRYMGWKPCV